MNPREIVRQIGANWTRPGWWRYVALPFAVRVGVLQPYYRYTDGETGHDFMAEDWDNLLILDACRYDTFADLWDGPGTLETRRSPGSNTPEFLTNTFGEGQFDDVVYVTANPQVNLHVENAFHAVVNVWESDWDTELNTVPPEPMADATLDAYERYPDKRLIAHFVQPHYPFVGEFARRAFDEQAGLELSRELATEDSARTAHDHIWLRLKTGRVDVSTVRRAYRENLAVTIPQINRIIERVEEPTVVTSDHGNSFGTRATPLGIPIWGHPRGVKIPELVRVPWLRIDGTRRKTIVSESVPQSAQADRSVVDERLSDLGYVT